MEMYEYLKQYQEEVPEWLVNYKPGDDFNFEDIIKGRLAYYPGFGYDGMMLTVGNKSHAVHSFVHTDYMNTRDNIERQINNVRGYHVIGRKEWNIEEVLPLPEEGTNYRHAYNKMIERAGDWIKRWTDDTPYLITHIMERDSDREDEYGATRFVITTANIDGFVLYLLLFMEKRKKAPWLFLLQDHGLGGNHNRFGKGGWMEYSMKAAGKWPRFVISDNNYGTHIWDGYTKIRKAHPVTGGMHHNLRYLWKYDPIPVYSNFNPFDIEGSTTLNNLDPLFEECAKFLVEKPIFTAADIQRRYHIGYNRVARLMDQLEEKGVITGIDSNRCRKILISKDELEDLLNKLKSAHG